MKLKRRSRASSSAQELPEDHAGEGQLSDSDLCAALEQALRRAAALLATHPETATAQRDADSDAGLTR